MDGISSAPSFEIPTRDIFAVEHPMIVKNLNKGLSTFGSNRPFRRILESEDPEECVPLYLRPNDPMCVPLLSHNSATNNVLLRITVPKRTGKKRKRGSEEPYETEDDDVTVTSDHHEKNISNSYGTLQSHSRLDSAVELLRKLRDNPNTYAIEAIGEVRQTHRYRSMADFQQSTSNTEFVPKFEKTALTGDIAKLRQFRFNPAMGWKPNDDILPPPAFTHNPLPFNWGWHQNPNVITMVDQHTGESELQIRRSAPRKEVEYVSGDIKAVPQNAPQLPTDPKKLELIAELQQAINERPIWTRRALLNRVSHSPRIGILASCLHYVGYQFRGGPYRDTIIRYGLDPREDQTYRKYQTIFFKLYSNDDEKVHGAPWYDIRTNYSVSIRTEQKGDFTSHIFDGKSLTLDGKVWQFCDITDPLLARLVRDSLYREEYEPKSDGWFTNGAMAKIRAIMKVKLIAICVQRELSEADFRDTLNVPDHVPDKTSSEVRTPIPDVQLTGEQIAVMKEKGLLNAFTTSGLRRKEVKSKKRTVRIHAQLNKKNAKSKGPRNNISKQSQDKRASTSLPVSPPHKDGMVYRVGSLNSGALGLGEEGIISSHMHSGLNRSAADWDTDGADEASTDYATELGTIDEVEGDYGDEDDDDDGREDEAGIECESDEGMDEIDPRDVVDFTEYFGEQIAKAAEIL